MTRATASDEFAGIKLNKEGKQCARELGPDRATLPEVTLSYGLPRCRQAVDVRK